MSVVAFQTRARTIDHLGRGQIADCPTAVSELWKNAYDAYANEVALHIFDGPVPIAAVTDNGHGMDHEEFVDRWLIVGTDAKVTDSITPRDDRNGLPVRAKQGEKGIGRLSIAFLGPKVFVISKRKGKPFVAALVDWRLFENPFLLLGDVRLPVQQFDEKSELESLLPQMFSEVGENVIFDVEADPPAKGEELARRERLVSAWDRYSTIQRKNKQPDTAREIIADLALADGHSRALLDRCLAHWPVWNDLASHGTALFVVNVNHELAVWVDPTVPRDDPEAESIKSSLRETLIGFVDPYLPESIDFKYRVTIHNDEKQVNAVSSDRVFSWGELRALEHLVEGSIDEAGVFTGRIKAFGRELGEVRIPPPDRNFSAKPRAFVGSFDICIGSYESGAGKTSMSPEQHRHVDEMAVNYAGLAIYRDQLRVMPYGRAQADYFGIEERRSTHLGRWFWSYRRTFGRVAISRDANPNLKDKAGREGLIDNQAKREFRNLVVELLKTTALRFFGTDSPVRKEYLPEIQTANKAAEDAEKTSQERRTVAFRRALRERLPSLAESVKTAGTLQEDIERIVATKDIGSLARFEPSILELEAKKSELKLPARPAKLGSLEDDYRKYRDQYAGFCAAADDVRARWAVAVEKIKKRPAVDEARSTSGVQLRQLHDALGDWCDQIIAILSGEERRIRSMVQIDEQRYPTQAEPLIEDLAAGRTSLPALLSQLEGIRESLYLDFAQRYGGYLRVIENLSVGIDVDALTAWSIEQRQKMEGRVEQLHALAQLGVTVELVGHEIEVHYDEITRYIELLPRAIQQLKPWQDLKDAVKALFDRLRFVTPLQLSGKRYQREITGEQIVDYLMDFFEGRLERARITFTATERFRGVHFREYAARIIPVFINLVNNSIYWVSLGDRREILLDSVGDEVIVSDSGRGVDQDDLKELFELFFTRRTGGRGVGLYLCRANLAAGGHSIAYATDKAHRLLPGANFVIKIRGMQNA